MGFTLYNLFKAGLLATNGVVILHPKRFLSRLGLHEQNTLVEGEKTLILNHLTFHLPSLYPTCRASSSDYYPFLGKSVGGLHNQIVGLLQAAAYLKFPLIFCNALVIFVELIAGG